ncbi:DUF6695 family protein [Ochrovirga pacifica]|uniref:DUF6695 family protein n=1 Tax=Ochrovirga pacifica TaxID=1042376 RepID=UPI00030CA577|nr:DUF6695 family protein [Ochrovirga pacifica]
MADGIIVILAYPDTVVRPAYAELSSKIWPLLGVGSKHAVQAGHAALLLIALDTGNVDYYDFGRYITSNGYGRVRSKETDVELHIPIKAVIKNKSVVNLDDLLLWLDCSPEKTHGEGRLIAGQHKEVDYSKAQKIIAQMQAKDQLPYGAFVKKGSNCARFVTDVLTQATKDKKTQKKLRKSQWFTPSPIANVINGTNTGDLYHVHNQQVRSYQNRSIVKEHLACFLNKFDNDLQLLGTELPNLALFQPEHATWLGGIGSGAWFQLVVENEMYLVRRFSVSGTLEFQGVFVPKTQGFAITSTFSFVYPTHCAKATLYQNGKNFVFIRKED